MDNNVDDLIEGEIERRRTDNQLDPIDRKEEKRNAQCFKCVRHRTNYNNDNGGDIKFCGPDPTTWFYHECTLKPGTTGANKFLNCMYVNPNGECKDFRSSGIIFKPEWTYRNLEQYREYLKDRYERVYREQRERTPSSFNRPIKTWDWLAIVAIIILLALASN